MKTALRMIILFGALITAAFLLCSISMFTKKWMTFWQTHHSIGVVPFPKREDTWFQIVAVLTYISFILYFPLFAFFLWIVTKVYRNGCNRSCRVHLEIIALFQFVMFLIELGAFVDFGLYVHFETNIIGFPPFLLLASSILLIISSVVSASVARNLCVDQN